MNDSCKDCYIAQDISKQLAELKGRVVVTEKDIEDMRIINSRRDEQYNNLDKLINGINSRLDRLIDKFDDLRIKPMDRYEKIVIYVITTVLGIGIVYIFTK